MSAGEGHPAAAADILLRAREAYGAGDWAACRAHLDEARARDPESMELKRWQARLAWRQDDWQALAEAGGAYLALHPNDREIAQLSARAYANLKRWNEAALAWAQVAALRPDWPEAWFQLARAQLRCECAHLAAASARRLSALAGADAALAAVRLAYERGQMAETAGHLSRLAAEAPERAVEELRAFEKKSELRGVALAAAAVAAQGEDYQAIAKTAADKLLPRALSAERRGRPLDAHLEYAVLAQVAPGDVIAKTGMRRTLLALQEEAKDSDRRRARKAWLQILFLYPGDSRALTSLGQIAMAEQEWSKAAGLWSALLEMSPKDIKALVQKARALDRAQDFPRADAAWRAVLAVEPENIEAELALSKLPQRLVKAGREAVEAQRYIEAVALFSAVPADSPEHDNAARRLDQVARLLKQKMRADYKARHFERVVHNGVAAVAAAPEQDELQRLLAQAAMRTRNYEIAAAAWRKVMTLAIGETRSVAILNLAKCHLRLGEAEESRSLVAALLREEPENADAAALAREIAADIQLPGGALPAGKDA